MSLHHLEEDMSVRDMAWETLRIYAPLEDQQASYQVVLFKVEGKIAMHPTSILISHDLPIAM